jgi:succinyl-diaminopimelate desuccinylase
MKTDRVAEYLQAHRDRFEDDLISLLRIPSISAQEAHRADVRRAAEWVLRQFEGLNFQAGLIETDGAPLVYAESPPVPGRPTALVYGHYDVQPPDPLDEWQSPPFEPTRRGGNIYARGATDDKGQMLTHIKSAQAWMEAEGYLPIQVKYLIEGEEEVGSRAVTDYLAEHGERLACDVVVISDTSQFGPGKPAITYGLRGIAYFELILRGPRQDLHSGTFGGAVVNPANALASLLSQLIDAQGRVRIPGFYDHVEPLSEREVEQLDNLPFDEAAFRRQIGVSAVGGEAGFSTLQRRWTRPTYDVHGLTSGYQLEGAKTVLPAKASAKFSFRLVPRQCPAEIAANLRSFLESRCPPGIDMQLIDHHGAPAFLMPLESPYLQAAARAIESGFGCPPLFIREGGSIPIVTDFQRSLGVDALLLGWGLDDDNTHGPNEKFSLTDFHRGIAASARLWRELANSPPG